MHFFLGALRVNIQVQGHHPDQWGPFQVYVAGKLQVPGVLFLGSTVVSIHSRQSCSVNFFYVILALPDSFFLQPVYHITTRTLHMSKPAKPSISQNEVNLLKVMEVALLTVQ